MGGNGPIPFPPSTTSFNLTGQAIHGRTAEEFPRCVSTLRLISHADISQKQLILAAAFCHVGICRCSLPWESSPVHFHLTRIPWQHAPVAGCCGIASRLPGNGEG